MSPLEAARGRIGWLELNGPRAAPAGAFYAQLFAWTLRPLHSASFGGLPMFANGERVFANQFTSLGAFAPPTWHVWFLGRVEPALAAIRAGGGDPGQGVMSLGGHGRRLWARDPAGHAFGVFEPEGAIADEDLPGDPLAGELWSPRAGATAGFYAAVFGLEPGPEGVLGAEGRPRLFLRDTAFAIAPPRWVPCFRSLNPAADAERARRLGATEHVPVAERPGLGPAVVLDDPGGAYFGLARPL